MQSVTLSDYRPTPRRCILSGKQAACVHAAYDDGPVTLKGLVSFKALEKFMAAQVSENGQAEEQPLFAELPGPPQNPNVVP